MTEEQKPAAAGSVSSGVQEALWSVARNLRGRAGREVSVGNEEHGFDLEAMDQYADQIEAALTREEAPREDAGDVARLRAYERVEAIARLLDPEAWEGRNPPVMWAHRRHNALTKAEEALATSPARADEGSAS